MKPILIVEDNDLIRKLYKDKLEMEGFEVYLSDTVERAFSELEKREYGLILLDLMLPGGKNGFDFLEEVKKDKRYDGIPVFVLTNLEGEEKVAKEIGASEYLIKSNISPNVILEKVKKVLK